MAALCMLEHGDCAIDRSSGNHSEPCHLQIYVGTANLLPGMLVYGFALMFKCHGPSILNLECAFA
jgi:hypothetical protein